MECAQCAATRMERLYERVLEGLVPTAGTTWKKKTHRGVEMFKWLMFTLEMGRRCYTFSSNHQQVQHS